MSPLVHHAEGRVEVVRVSSDPVGGAWPCDRCGELVPVRGSWQVIGADHIEVRCELCVEELFDRSEAAAGGRSDAPGRR